MIPRLTAAAVAIWLLCPAVTARADGLLPPLPYRYLHPPPALAGSNQKPESGKRTVGVTKGQSDDAFVFTRDGQAGMSANPGAFAIPSGVKSIILTLSPIEPPAGLPSQLTVDGNAYNFQATGMPGNRPVPLRAKADLTMRWPHIPTAVYQYRNGQWRQLCYSNHFILSSSTVSCQTTSLGIFAAVMLKKGSVTLPVTPVSNTPWANLTRYIPIAAAIVLILIAALTAWFISRPRRADEEEE